jgi:hypothetical protein
MSNSIELIEAKRDAALDEQVDMHRLDAPELIARMVAARNARINLEQLYNAANLVVAGTVLSLVYRVVLSMVGEVSVSSLLFVDDLGLPTAAGFGATATLCIAVLAIGCGIFFAQWRKAGKVTASLWVGIAFGLAMFALSYLLAHYRLALSTSGGDLAAAAAATRKSASEDPWAVFYNIPILLFSVLNLAAGAWVAAKAGNLIAWRDLARLRRIEAETKAEVDRVREESLGGCAETFALANQQLDAFDGTIAQGCKAAVKRVADARSDTASTNEDMRKIAGACDHDQLRLRTNVGLQRAERGKADHGIDAAGPAPSGKVSFDSRLDAIKDLIEQQAAQASSAIAECYRRNSEALVDATARIAGQHQEFERQFADDPRAAIYSVT